MHDLAWLKSSGQICRACFPAFISALFFQGLRAGYLLAKQSPSLDIDKVGPMLGRNVLGVYCDDASRALKITCERDILAGSPGDKDVYGAQQHRKLLDLVL